MAESYFSHFSLNIQKENEKRIYSKIPFVTGIYTQKNITSDQYSVITHTDSESGIAGVIYLNFTEEYNGGTGFLKRNKETKEYEYIFKNKMEFNSLIMFDSNTFHNLYFDTPDAFSNSYRITQRFFIGNSK